MPPRTLKSIEADLAGQGYPLFATAIHERDAYRALFSFGGTLYDMKEDLVRNIPVAVKNARDFTAEVVAMLAKPARAPQRVEVA